MGTHLPLASLPIIPTRLHMHHRSHALSLPTQTQPRPHSASYLEPATFRSCFMQRHHHPPNPPQPTHPPPCLGPAASMCR